MNFIPEGAKRTRVELEHRNLDRYGAEAVELRKGMDAPEGWGKTLENFASVAAADAEAR